MLVDDRYLDRTYYDREVGTFVTISRSEDDSVEILSEIRNGGGEAWHEYGNDGTQVRKGATAEQYEFLAEQIRGM